MAGIEARNNDLAIAAASVYLMIASKKKKKKDRSCWTQPWLSRRKETGAYHCLLQELVIEDRQSAKTFLRMSVESFDELFSLVGPNIKKEDTVMREAVKPAERLAITLRYLGSGNSFTDLQYLFRVSPSCIRKIIIETCDAIYRTLKDIHLKLPSTPNEWRRVAREFDRKWNFPNCIGALDGKHVRIMAPNMGSNYFNYKGSHSIILLALVDANYKFLYYHVGAHGRAGDAGVFQDSALAHGLENKTMGIPDPIPLPERDAQVPYYIVGDDAFALKPYLMKPYPSRSAETQGEDGELERRKRRIFDYRLSRARRISENVFGILTARFGVFQTAIRLAPENATTVTLACIALHNFLMSQKDKAFLTPTLTDRETDGHETLPGDWRQTQRTCFESLSGAVGNRNTSDARWVRDELKEYVNNEGQVSWQERLVFGRVL